MIWAIRTSVLAAGAAALLSTQAVYAAPAASNPAIDPLVSLSVFGTAQSRAAVCAAGASAAAAGAAVTAAQAPGGCLFPVTAPPAPPPVTQAVPPPVMPAAAPKRIGTLPLILGLLAIIGIAAAVLTGGGDGEGDLAPISPA